MNDPRYYYKPRTDEQRRMYQLLQRRRLGIQDGHARLYALDIPEAYATEIRHDATWIANNKGWPAAQDFIRRVEKIDWALVDEMFDEWASYNELAEFFGVPGWYIEKRTRHLRRINPKRGTVEPRHE